MFLLDTSAVLELLYGTEKGIKIKELIYKKPISVSSFTIYEIHMGLKKNEIEKVNHFFKEISVIDFDQTSAEKSVIIEHELKQKGELINKVDIFIAGSCLVHGLNMVTCDNDFKKIKRLRVNIF